VTIIEIHLIEAIILSDVKVQIGAVVELAGVAEKILLHRTGSRGVSTKFHSRVVSKRQFVLTKVKVNQGGIFKACGFLRNRTAEAAVGKELATSKVHRTRPLGSRLQVEGLREEQRRIEVGEEIGFSKHIGEGDATRRDNSRCQVIVVCEAECLI
jgi:hypothetical protein